MTLRQLLLPYLSALLLAALGPCLSRANSGPQEDTIVMAKDFMFAPTSITIAAGSTVTWTNSDDEPHTVVSESGLFRSAALDTNERFSFRFAQPGTYRYTCSIHPRMVGTIIVR